MLPDTLDEAEVDEQVNEGVAVGDGALVAKLGSFNAQSDRLSIEAFGGGALVVDAFEGFRLSVELVTDTSAISQG